MAGALLLLNGCAVGPDFTRPHAPAVERYTRMEQPSVTAEADGQVQRFHVGDAVAADWWRLFNSDELDAAVQRAIANNPNLQAAEASLRRSQADLKAGYGVFYPQVGASFAATRARVSPLQLPPGGIFNLFTLGATVSYALDVFGAQRRTVEALGAEVDFQRSAMAAAYLTLTGNTVNTMIAWSAYQGQIEATERLIGLQEEQLEIARAQAQAGTAPYSATLAIGSQLASTEGTLSPLRQKRDQAEHLLATLDGRTPAEHEVPKLDLAALTLPPDLPVSLPSSLVRQRPDILAAEAQLHAASANIGIATAALFPSFSLNGAYGSNGTAVGGVGDNRFWSVGPSVNFPLFQGGTSWFKRKSAIEAYEQSLGSYRQTVLNAFAQVADALRALEYDADDLRAQRNAVDQAQQSLDLLQVNYRAGLVGYLEVIATDIQLHQAEINYLQSRAQRYQDTTALFMALGGGWWIAPPPIGEHPPEAAAVDRP